MRRNSRPMSSNKKKNNKIGLSSKKATSRVRKGSSKHREPKKAVVKRRNKELKFSFPKKSAENTSNTLQFKKKKKTFRDLSILAKVRLIVILSAVVLLAGLIVYLLVGFKVRNFTVEGSTHYSAQEIRDMVITDRFCENSLFLKLKLKYKKIENIPFVEHMDVQIRDRKSVHIIVYEKAIAGYVVYLENRMYFDKDGIVVESSKEDVPGIPEITGLNFDHVVLHEPLPVEDPRVFKEILSLTQLLNKNELDADKIYFDESGKVTLYFGDVRVPLGGDEYLEEKLKHLSEMLDKTPLSQLSGKLNMEKFTPDNMKSSFSFDEN